ncbi:MAG: glycosyltransferase family 39 protein [Candidatus Acidiferrales bacterium]
MKPPRANPASSVIRRKLRSFATSLTLIVIVATGVRLAFAWDYTQQNSRQALSVIPFTFEPGNIAASLARGQGFSSPLRVPTGPTAWMTPVYPLLLATVFRYFEIYTFRSFVAAVLLNIIFAVLTCVPIYYAGERMGGAGLGAAAAWLWAIFPNAILLPFESMWDACLSALLAATILWATLALAESRRARDWCAYGLLWGFTLMTNPTLASLLPFLLAWLAYRAYRAYEHAHKEARLWLLNPLLALGVAILFCVPWTVRNHDAFHTFVPLQSTLGLQLSVGNNAQSTDAQTNLVHPLDNADERAKYVEMGEIAYMRQKQHEAIAYMESHPRRVADLSAHRFVAFWTGGTSHPLEDLEQIDSRWFRYVLIFNICAGIGSLLGIILLFWRRSVFAFPLAVFPLVFPCVYYISLAFPRYRLPIDPAVLLLTAIATASAFHWTARTDTSQARNRTQA